MGLLFTYMVKAATGERPASFTNAEYAAWLNDGAGFDSQYHHPDMEQRLFYDVRRQGGIIGSRDANVAGKLRRLARHVRAQRRARGADYINRTLSQGGTLQPWAVSHLLLGYGITPDLLENKTFQERISNVDAADRRAVANVFRSMGINWDRKTEDYRDPAFIRSLQEGIRAGKYNSPGSTPDTSTNSNQTTSSGTSVAAQPQAAPQAPAPVAAQPQAPAPVAAQPQAAPQAPAPVAAPRIGTFRQPAFASSPTQQVSFYNLPAGMTQEQAMENWNRIGRSRIQRYLAATGRYGANNIQVSPDGSTIRLIHYNGGSTETDTSLPPPPNRREQAAGQSNLVRRSDRTHVVPTNYQSNRTSKTLLPPNIVSREVPQRRIVSREVPQRRIVRRETGTPRPQ